MARSLSRQGILLAVLLVVLAAVLVLRWRSWDAAVATTAPGTAPRVVGAKPQARIAANAAIPQIALGRLTTDSPEPVPASRNPFRMEARRPNPTQAAPDSTGQPPAGTPSETPNAPTVTPTPPIPLKFIGIVSAPGRAGRIAVLSDGRYVLHGHEGDIIDGRYRIIRIGVESIEMEYVDGRGRQIIRLTGS